MLDKNEKKCRNESLDLLRVVSMVFVICIHYVGWGGIASAKNVGIFNLAFSGGIAVACNCAVNCFYMLSGYFISGNENTKKTRKKILKVWVPTFIYSVSIPIILCILGYIKLSIKDTAMLFFPFMGNQYWFSTCFIAVTLLMPFIGPALVRLDDNQLKYLVCVIVLIDCVQPMLGYNAFSNIGYGLLHALTMYILGYFIRRINIHPKSIYCLLIFMMCIIIIGLLSILSIKIGGDRNRTIADYNSILMVIQSVSVFIFFTNLTIKKIRFSNITPYVFGVYLLNDNQYARNFLWQNVFHCSDFYYSKVLPFHFLIVTVSFLIFGLSVEWVRINIWKLLKKKGKKILVHG